MRTAERIIFAGTPDFAARALNALVQANNEIIAVYTQPDRPAGRGKRVQPGPVKMLAQQYSIPVMQPENFRSPSTLAELEGLAPDLLIVAAYGLLLPAEVLAIPTLGCINIHASLLPRWRGAAPIHRAIEAGDQTTGITLMQMDAGLDTGDILSMTPCPILDSDTSGSLHDRLAALGGEEVVRALPGLRKLQSDATRQPDSGITYAAKIRREEAEIDWTLGATAIERKIRAFNPYPVAWTRQGADVLRIHRAAAETGSDTSPGTNSTPGQVYQGKDGLPTVQCGQGSLQIIEMQMAGGRRLPATEVQRGRPAILSPGCRLG